jgi:hypothetical protein
MFLVDSSKSIADLEQNIILSKTAANSDFCCGIETTSEGSPALA